MNFDFSDEQKQLRDEARKFLTEKCPPKAVRTVLDGKQPYDRELWNGLAGMGFLGVAIPEAYGGAGAVFLHRLPGGGSASARRQRCAEAEMAAADRIGRGDRHAGTVRRQGQSVAASNKTLGLRRQPQWREEAGA